MFLHLTDENGEHYDSFDVSEWIGKKNKKCIFDILAYFNTAIELLYERTERDKILISLLKEINRKIELADEYVENLQKFTDDAKLWEAARQFIISNNLREEFNLFCDERFK